MEQRIDKKSRELLQEALNYLDPSSPGQASILLAQYMGSSLPTIYNWRKGSRRPMGVFRSKLEELVQTLQAQKRYARDN